MIASNLFLDIFMSAHKKDRVKSMQKLSKKELYILLMLIYDKHDKTNENVIFNCKPFKSESLDIYNLLDTGDTSVTELLELQKETKDPFIDLETITDTNGKTLPDINDVESFRNYRLKILKE